MSALTMKALQKTGSSLLGKRIMSGIQPTGEAHLGNYLGAIRNWIQLSNNLTPIPSMENKKMILSIVDLHALTTNMATTFNHSTNIANETLNMACTIIACGLNMDNTLLYVQSTVSEHSELLWILSCFSSMGYLQRMPQYKEKIQSLEKQMTVTGNQKQMNVNENLGLFSYPVLQSADILLFDSDLVPVGEDQMIHLNFTRDLVDRMNAIYNRELFVKPNILLTSEMHSCGGNKIMSLKNPMSKMSKSENAMANDKSMHMGCLYLTDSYDSVCDKVRKSVSDSYGPYVSYDEENRKGLANLIRIYSLLRNISIDEVVEEFVDCKTVVFKDACAEVIYEYVCPIGNEIGRLRKSEIGEVEKILEENGRNAKEIAYNTMLRVKKAIGLLKS